MLLYVMSSSEMEGTYHKSQIYVSNALWQIGAICKGLVLVCLAPTKGLLPSSAKPTSLIAGAVTWAHISRIPSDFIHAHLTNWNCIHCFQHVFEY